MTSCCSSGVLIFLALGNGIEVKVIYQILLVHYLLMGSMAFDVEHFAMLFELIAGGGSLVLQHKATVNQIFRSSISCVIKLPIKLIGDDHSKL